MKIVNSVLTGLLTSVLFLAGAEEAARVPTRDPVRLGVAPAGSYLLEQAHIDPLAHPPFFEALQDLGANMVCYFLRPVTDAGDGNSEETRKQVEAIDSAMRAFTT